MSKNSFNILYFPEIPSTNLYAMENLDTLAHRQIIVAERQTQGQGQFGRTWVSDRPGNVYMSIVLKPSDETIYLVNLTRYTATIINNTLKAYNVTSRIKPPNDVLVNNVKIAGILCQSAIQGQKTRGVVVGIGVNLNMTRDDLDKIDQPATSLNLVLGKPVSKEDFMVNLLQRFFENL